MDGWLRQEAGVWVQLVVFTWHYMNSKWRALSCWHLWKVLKYEHLCYTWYHQIVKLGHQQKKLEKKLISVCFGFVENNQVLKRWRLYEMKNRRNKSNPGSQLRRGTHNRNQTGWEAGTKSQQAKVREAGRKSFVDVNSNSYNDILFILTSQINRNREKGNMNQMH